MMDFTWITYIMIIAVFVIFTFKVIDMFLIPKKKEIIPRDAEERLFKYIVTASRTNPNASKYLYLTRTEFAPGGYVGKIIGKVSEHGFTKFAIRKFGKKVIYVPRYLHTSLHLRDVFIDAQDLEYVNGFFFPIPFKLDGRWNSMEEYKDACIREIEKDVSKITTMDLIAFRDQVNKIAISGYYGERKIREKEELKDLEEKEEK